MRHETGYTGGLTEREVLGEARPEKEAERDAERSFYTFDTLVELIKEQQPLGENPSEPTKRFPNDLHATIAEKLGLENYEQLKYFTAVGSKLDRYKGVDAFFELDLGSGDRVIITLDITKNTSKGDYKADVCFVWPNEGISSKEDRKEWLEKVEEVAESVAGAARNRADMKSKVIRSLSAYELEESKKISEERRRRILLKLQHA